MNLDKYIERLKPVCKECGGSGKVSIKIVPNKNYLSPYRDCTSCTDGIQPIDQQALILDIVGNLVDARMAFKYKHIKNKVVGTYFEKYLALALKNLLILCSSVGKERFDNLGICIKTVDKFFPSIISEITNLFYTDKPKMWIHSSVSILVSFATHHGIDLIKHLDALLDHEGEKDG